MPKRPYPKLQIRLVAVGLSVLCGVLLPVGPARAVVANKIYEIWIATTPGQTAVRTCARFTATTLLVDLCGSLPGTFQEVVLVNELQNSVTQWSAVIPCTWVPPGQASGGMGQNTVFRGTSADGRLGNLPMNVMAASAYSAPGTSGRLAMSVAGVENQACR